jgi:hypothetical protein
MSVGLRPGGKCFTLYLQSDEDAEVIRYMDLVELRAMQKLFSEVKL